MQRIHVLRVGVSFLMNHKKVKLPLIGLIVIISDSILLIFLQYHHLLIHFFHSFHMDILEILLQIY